MHKCFVSLLATGTFFVSTIALAQGLNSQDRKFLEESAKGGMMEVHMGHMALEKGKSEAVKSFGQRMVNDHSKANQELTELARRKGVVLPQDDSTVGSKALSITSGALFDRGYTKTMVSDHENDIKEFEKEVS